ncbi:hypothetical protein ACP3WE_24790, partial [Salmonella enterica]|uniref:hypothetical protein n=1 Tax=Salmonella enterica TaxID=28901 RepID=UPI003CF4FF12
VPGLGGAQPAAADIVEGGRSRVGLGLTGAVAIEQGGGVRGISPQIGGKRESGVPPLGDTPYWLRPAPAERPK